MLTLTLMPCGDISIKSDYYYRDRIKTVLGARFDYDTKEWIVPYGALGLVEKEFRGELVYKTPRWVMHNEPMPDMEAMYRIHDQTITVPVMKLKPYDYQRYGIRFMIDRILRKGFVLNADDVGLGKTLMTIGTLKWFIENRNVRKILIICKKSIKGQWIDEIMKFTDFDVDGYRLIKTGSTVAKRRRAYDEFEKSGKAVLVTNYHSFINDTDQFLDMDIEFVVIDEVHSIKAREGVLNNNIGKVVTGKPTVFLTGTPIMSKPEDIYGIIQMVDKNYFGEWNWFCRRYLTIETHGIYGPRVVGAKNLDELRGKVQDIVIRRTEFEVSIQLPKVVLKRINCEMDAVQVAILQKIQFLQDEINNAVETLRNDPSRDPETALKLEKLDGIGKSYIAAKQAASTDPRMFLMTKSKMMQAEFGSLIPKQYSMSSKTEVVLDYVEDIIKSDDKVILFTKFRMCAQMVASDIEHKLKEKVLLYTGAEGDDERDEAVRKFRDTTTYNILIGTEAMAEGLNLQHARYIINIDQPDTFAIKTQRIGRARRTGSSFGSVIVYDMITQGNDNVRSKDEERLENIKNNQNVTDAFVSINEAQRVALVEAMKLS